VSSIQEKTGADLIADWLKAQNAEAVFSLQGGTIMPAMDAVYRSGVPQYFFIREDGAGFAAIGYAKATNRPGVLMVSSGPGATNAVTPISDAMRDCVPLVVITGQVPTFAKDTDAFQETNITSIVRSITKKTFYVEFTNNLEPVLNEAFSVAVSGKPGPVLVDLPKDVQNNSTNVSLPIEPYTEWVTEIPFDPDNNFDKVIDALNVSERPVIIAGNGLILAEVTQPFREFIDTTGIPVVHTLPAKGVLPSGHACNFGMLGMHGVYTAGAAVEYCDLVISLGSRYDDRITGNPGLFAPDASHLVHFDIDRGQIEKVLSDRKLGVLGDLCDGIQALNESIPYIKNTDRFSKWLRHLNEIKSKHPLPTSQYADTEQLDIEFIFSSLNNVLQKSDGDIIYATEIGQHQMWTSQRLDMKEGNLFISSTGQGAMGSGFPQALGAQIACPDRQVICLAGDGSFRLNSPEMETMVRYNLPLKIFIFNNGGYGIVRQWNETFFEKRLVGVQHHGFDFVAVAAAFGVQGAVVEKKADLTRSIENALAYDGPYILEMKIPWEPCLPFIPPGTSFSEIIEK
jgi:acetolactate synthase-1/2/3 large subunit